MQAVDFEETIDKIVARSPRYCRDAYVFVREALDHTQKKLGKPKKEEIRHVSGQELLSGIRDYTLRQFGPMSLMVLGEWGISRCEDFGEIVFNMVEARLLATAETDSREDFKSGYAFQEAFVDPFLPSARRAPRVTQARPAQA